MFGSSKGQRKCAVCGVTWDPIRDGVNLPYLKDGDRKLTLCEYHYEVFSRGLHVDKALEKNRAAIAASLKEAVVDSQARLEAIRKEALALVAREAREQAAKFAGDRAAFQAELEESRAAREAMRKGMERVALMEKTVKGYDRLLTTYGDRMAEASERMDEMDKAFELMKEHSPVFGSASRDEEIVNFVANRPGGAGFGEIRAEFGIAISSADRALKRLVSMGRVVKGPDRKYRLA